MLKPMNERPAVSNRTEPLQRGAVLVITLVMLLLVTLIGVVGMQGTNLQERMAGNLWDRNKAFQGAETALRVGESWLEGPAAAPGTGVSRRAAAELHTALTAPAKWDGSSGQPVLSGSDAEYGMLEGVIADQDDNPVLAGIPDLHIDPPAFVRLPSDINLNQAELECQRYYPVTSRSVGGSDTAVVILRSSYIPRQSGMVICPNLDPEPEPEP
jgi:type IV pilus assembly protein PilX